MKGDEHFVIVKLVSGEQVMAVLEHEYGDSVLLSYPMLIRLFPIVGKNAAHEHVTATPYSQFAASSTIRVNKNHILFLENLHHLLIPHFQQLVEEQENRVLVQKDKDGSVRKAEDLSWGDEEELLEGVESLTTEEIEKRIAMLESIFGKEEETTENDKEDERVFIEGNDTVH